MILIIGKEHRANETPEPIKINTGSNSIRAATFTANSKYLLSGDTEGVQVWRVDDGKRMATMAVNGTVHCLAVSRNEGWIAAGTFWGDVIVWNAMTYAKVVSHREDNSTIHAVDFAPDSTRLVAGSENRTASIWDVATCKRVRTLRHENPVIGAKYAPRGDRIATATKNSVRVYDASEGHTLLADIPVNVTSYYNTGILWSNDQLVVLSGGGIKRIAWSSAEPPSELDWLVPVNYLPRGIALPRHEEFIACAGSRTVTFWDTSLDATQTRSKPGVIQYPENIHAVALSPDDRFIAIGGESGEILVQIVPHRVNVGINVVG